MKKILIFTIVTIIYGIVLPATLKAQKGFCLGANVGANYVTTYDHILYGDVAYRNKLIVGPAYGAAIGYNFTNMIGVEGELNFLTMGGAYRIPMQDKHFSETLTLNYLQVPLMLKFTGGNYKTRFSSMFGVVFGFRGDSRITNDSSGTNTTYNVASSFKGPDLGLLLSGGGDITLKNDIYLNLALRFYVGLATINSDPKILVNLPGENETLGNAYAGINVGIYNLFRGKKEKSGAE